MEHDGEKQEKHFIRINFQVGVKCNEYQGRYAFDTNINVTMYCINFSNLLIYRPITNFMAYYMFSVDVLNCVSVLPGNKIDTYLLI